MDKQTLFGLDLTGMCWLHILSSASLLHHEACHLSLHSTHVQAGLMALAALLFIQDMIQGDYADPATTIPGYPDYKVIERMLMELAYLMLVAPGSSSAPQTRRNVTSGIQLGLAASLAYSSHVTDIKLHHYLDEFIHQLMSFLARHPPLLLFAEATFGPVMWARASNIISTLCKAAGNMLPLCFFDDRKHFPDLVKHSSLHNSKGSKLESDAQSRKSCLGCMHTHLLHMTCCYTSAGGAGTALPCLCLAVVLVSA